MSKDEFVQIGNQSFPRSGGWNFYERDLNSAPSSFQIRYWKGLFDGEVLSFIVDEKYGKGVYRIKYGTRSSKIDSKIVFKKFKEDLYSKYGNPNKLIDKGDNHGFCYGPHCDKIKYYDHWDLLDDSLFESPTEGCHLIVKWLGHETAANITFYLFDSTPNLRYRENYEDKMKKKSEETKVKF